MQTTMPSVTLRDYWDIAVRRRKLIAGITLLSLLVAGILVLVLPKSYRSNTLVLVESQKIPEDYVKGISGGSIEERLTMIQQQVMSRTLLTRVIDEFKLYEDAVKQKGFDATIDDMRKNIRVETVGTVGVRGRSVEAFSISFAHENPMTAMKVTAKLASQFIEENLRVREQLVEGASEFLEQELTRSKADLEVQEKAISEFKKKFIGELPEQTEINLRALDRLQIDLTTASETQQSLTDRLKMVDKAITDYQAAGIVPPGAMPGTPGGFMDPTMARLKELERNLANLQADYKETYPDILQTKKEIAEIKKQLGDKKGEGDDKDKDFSPGKVFDPYLLGLMRQRDDVKIEITTMKERQKRIREQIADYEGRIKQAPAREQALMTLVRDYENQRKNYQSLLDKRLSARVAESLEKRQKGEQFRIIDPAHLPEKAEKPDPLRIFLICLVGGVALGFGAAVMVEQMNPSFRRPEEAEYLLGIPLLASIPSFGTLMNRPARGLPFHSNRPLLTGPVQAGGGQPPAMLSFDKEDHANGKGKGNGNGNGHGNGSSTGRLGWIQQYWSDWVKPGNGKKRFADKPNPMDQLTGELNLVVKWSPLSVVAEQFRVAATRLALMAAERRNTVVVVTSSVTGEGKSSTSVNLAYTLARDLGKSTLLIDCDFKCPAVNKYMGMALEPGVAEVLHGTCSVRASMVPVGEWPLWVIPAGNQKRRAIELSKVGQLAAILNDLRPQFDYIILDAPPILPLADMNVLASMADIMAMVVRAETTGRDVVQTALNTLKPSIPAGLILTGLTPTGIPYYMQQPYYIQSEKVHRVS